MDMKKTLLTLAAMMFATSAMGQLQYDMTPDTGPVKGGANKVVTEVFTVEKKNGKWVRAGKPDPWGEMGVYPEESECTYDRNGKLTSKTTVFEGTKTEYAYQYTTDGKLAETKKTENGKLTSVMRYRYTAGKLTGTSEDTFYNGQKSTQDSPITTGKTETDAAGNVTEHGDQPSDYVKRDRQGRLLEFSINNEMDGYVDSRKYTYDEEGRVVKIEVSDGDTLTYHYVKQDEKGNWTGLLIVSGETPIGAVDRKIIYY